MLLMRELSRRWTASKILSNKFFSIRTYLSSRIVSTTLGKVRGAERMTLYEDCYYSFEGIPFAKPPLGDLRFKAPQPPEPWGGVRDCFEPSCKPTQLNEISGKPEGGEDCLYLNVYVKTLESESPLPVLVWIVGGAFTYGEGSGKLYGPDYFMQTEVVLVCFNYRLCSLGFLSLADPELQVPGNAGLKDQVQALRWIKENISCFNGDANNIFLFGESAGGVSAHYMTATEQTRGLFQKAAIMSGCLLHSWSNEPQLDYGYRLAKKIGYTGENCDDKVLNYLRCAEETQLVKHEIMTDEDKLNGKFFLFAPTVEPYESKDCVVPKAPIEMMRTAWGNEIPMMLGGTSFEGLVMYDIVKKNPGLIALLAKIPELVLPLDVRVKNKPERSRELALELMKLHCLEAMPNPENMLKYLNFISYKFFWHGIQRTAMSRLEFAKAPTYLYRFEYDSPKQSFHRKKYCGNDPVEGVAHADELPYLFSMQDSWSFPCESPEYKMIQRMVGIWTAFAKCSDPNNALLKPTVWQPLKKYEANMALNIGNTVEMKEIPECSKLQFWNSMYQTHELY